MPRVCLDGALSHELCGFNLPALPKFDTSWYSACLWIVVPASGPYASGALGAVVRVSRQRETYCRVLFVILCYVCNFSCRINNFPSSSSSPYCDQVVFLLTIITLYPGCQMVYIRKDFEYFWVWCSILDLQNSSVCHSFVFHWNAYIVAYINRWLQRPTMLVYHLNEITLKIHYERNTFISLFCGK